MKVKGKAGESILGDLGVVRIHKARFYMMSFDETGKENFVMLCRRKFVCDVFLIFLEVFPFFIDAPSVLSGSVPRQDK